MRNYEILGGHNLPIIFGVRMQKKPLNVQANRQDRSWTTIFSHVRARGQLSFLKSDTTVTIVRI